MTLLHLGHSEFESVFAEHLCQDILICQTACVSSADQTQFAPPAILKMGD